MTDDTRRADATDDSTDPTSATRQTVFDPGSDPVSETLVLAVAEAAGTPALELPALSGTVDPDALDRLFTHQDRAPDADGVRLSFAYAGFAVTVDSVGVVTITPE